MFRKIQRRSPARGWAGHFQPPECFFCLSSKSEGEEKKPDYKDVEILCRFISDRGKIIPRERSGICAKHQRQLSRAIKRTRYLGLLPFTAKI